MSKKTSPKKSPAKSAPKSQVKSQVKSQAKPQAIPKGLYASATPGPQGGASYASGGNSSSERAANGSSPHQIKEGGASYASGGNASSEPSFSSAKAENQSNSDGSSPHQIKEGGASYGVFKDSGGGNASSEPRAQVAGGGSANKKRANDSSPQPNQQGGVSHGHGGNSSSERVVNDSSPQPNQNDMTVARMLGEIVWIMTQSPGHKHFSLGDLEWMVMPALLLEQYRIFRNGDQPLGVALWAYLSPEAEEKLKSGSGRLRPDEWAVGMKLDPEDGVSSAKGGALWLVDLICPFHTPDNKMADQMLADLMGLNDSGGPFKGKKFKFHHTDPVTGTRKVMELGG